MFSLFTSTNKTASLHKERAQLEHLFRQAMRNHGVASHEAKIYESRLTQLEAQLAA